MKTSILKSIRRLTVKKYKPEKRCINGKDGWYLMDGNIIKSPCLKTREEAIALLKVKWHEEAEKFLRLNRYKRKTRNYVW